MAGLGRGAALERAAQRVEEYAPRHGHHFGGQALPGERGRPAGEGFGNARAGATARHSACRTSTQLDGGSRKTSRQRFMGGLMFGDLL